MQLLPHALPFVQTLQHPLATADPQIGASLAANARLTTAIASHRPDIARLKTPFTAFIFRALPLAE